MEGITRLATGFPVQLTQSSGDLSLTGSSTDFPNVIGKVVTLDPHKSNPGCPTTDGTGCYFLPPLAPQDPNQCLLPGGQPASGGAFNYNCTLGTFGTADRRFFHGPGFNNTDFGMLKHTAINERFAFDLRIEFFNIFNHPQFQNPSGDISGGSFGVVSSARDPRIGQISAKFYW